MATEQRDSARTEGADAGPLSAWLTQTTSDRSDAPVVESDTLYVPSPTNRSIRSRLDDSCRDGAVAGLGGANAPPHLHHADGDAADEDPPPKLPGLEWY